MAMVADPLWAVVSTGLYGHRVHGSWLSSAGVVETKLFSVSPSEMANAYGQAMM